MISLSSELTDSKGRRARQGWIFFDGDCSRCIALARRWGPRLEPRGFALAPLQDPRVQALLGLPREELLREMRVLAADGKQYGGADALLYLWKQVWWTWPLSALARLPGMRQVLRAGYRWVAARRNCASSSCRLGEAGSRVLAHSPGKEAR
jgi:predicted DCC family thiol-disulfide oxidoreductase YuxK